MATAKEFVARIAKIDGVAGCLLVREDGEILGSNVDNADDYTALMVLGGTSACGIMDKVGFSHCEHVSFNRKGRQHFTLFPIGQYYLGVLLSPDCFIPDMLQAVMRLIGRVTTGSSSAEE